MQLDDPAALESLISRLRALRSDAARQWGTMTAGEMLCHLDGANRIILQKLDDLELDPDLKPRRILKWVALYSPLTWSKKAQTHPRIDPKRDGDQPDDFAADRERVIEGLRAIAAAPPEDLAPAHGLFGPMSPRDWYRSAYRHTDHHLRQFGA